MLNRVKSLLLLALFVSAIAGTFAQQAPSSWVKLDTVKAGKFDTGKMWTFDFPPKQFFQSEYNFKANDDWFDKVRMSALRFATYCSASFVSGDGLVMTNHHCARESVTEVQKEGEDFHANGFWAPTLADERIVKGLFVDQLTMIKDVTAEMHDAIDKADAAEKVKIRDEKKKEIEKRYKDETGLECSVVTLYNGGKYSLYGFKRYNDVRLVFAPETQLGFYGGDPDNFTYPRYALDCSFFRVYDEAGKPLKTENFFKWSSNGANDGEPVFVVGNPGRTGRLRTVAQLEYAKNTQYPVAVYMLNELVKAYQAFVDENPVDKAEWEDRLFSFSNSWKASNGILSGLRDDVLMQKKRAFEATFKADIAKKPELQAKYGDLWKKIEDTRAEVSKIAFENSAYNLSPVVAAQYFAIAKKLVEFANQMKKTEDQRDAKFKGEELKKTTDAIFPAKFEKSLQDKLLRANINFLGMLLGGNNILVSTLEKNAASSSLTSAEGVQKLVDAGADAILGSNDPFITYVIQTTDKGKELKAKITEITTRESDYVQQLGRGLFEVYGTEIPPDATFTLRISDGIVKGYDYNGTTAPSKTTFYGLYDRYYSFDKKYPWSLPERWQHPSPEFNLETPMVFVSTNDIIGGNSGSPVINQKAEIVGLAFDGNIESLPGEFIFTTEANRTLSVHSAGMFEVIQDLYLAKRLSKELRAGKISE